MGGRARSLMASVAGCRHMMTANCEGVNGSKPSRFKFLEKKTRIPQFAFFCGVDGGDIYLLFLAFGEYIIWWA